MEKRRQKLLSLRDEMVILTKTQAVCSHYFEGASIYRWSTNVRQTSSAERKVYSSLRSTDAIDDDDGYRPSIYIISPMNRKT